MIMSQERRKLASGREVLAVQGKFQRISSSTCQQKCLISFLYKPFEGFQILTDRKKAASTTNKIPYH